MEAIVMCKKIRRSILGIAATALVLMPALGWTGSAGLYL
jgi:hypothetical protein